MLSGVASCGLPFPPALTKHAQVKHIKCFWLEFLHGRGGRTVAGGVVARTFETGTHAARGTASGVRQSLLLICSSVSVTGPLPPGALTVSGMAQCSAAGSTAMICHAACTCNSHMMHAFASSVK